MTIVLTTGRAPCLMPPSRLDRPSRPHSPRQLSRRLDPGNHIEITINQHSLKIKIAYERVLRALLGCKCKFYAQCSVAVTRRRGTDGSPERGGPRAQAGNGTQ